MNMVNPMTHHIWRVLVNQPGPIVKRTNRIDLPCLRHFYEM